MPKRSREDPNLNSVEDDQPSNTDSLPSQLQESDSPSFSAETPKIIHLDDSVESDVAPQMLCSLPGHRQAISFKTYEDYEIHYNKTHVNRCLECLKNFPTSRFLQLHISENHDPLVAIRKERGEKTFACFIDDCNRLCSTPNKRRMHLIDKHMFPKDYDFSVTAHGIDHRHSMLRQGRNRRRSSVTLKPTNNDQAAQTPLLQVVEEGPRKLSEGKVLTPPLDRTRPKTPEQPEPDSDINALTGSMSSLAFVPPSVRFGRRGGKATGRGRSSRERN